MSKPRFVEVAVSVFLIVILVSEATIYLAPIHNTLSVNSTVSIATTPEGYYINSSFQVPFSASFVQSYLWEPSGVPSWHLYVYLDPAYPSYTSIAEVVGIDDHFSTVAAYRHADSEITVVNTSQLVNLLEAPPLPDDVLVMATGAIPDLVAQPNTNLLANWITSGGSVLWIGYTIGYLVSSLPNSLSSTIPTNDSGWFGTARFVPYSFTMGGGPSSTSPTYLRRATFSTTPSIFTTSSALGTAVGIDYPYTIFPALWNVSKLAGAGDLAIGNTWANWTNVAWMHVGKGILVDFAGPLEDVTPLSIWLANLLQSGFLTEHPMVLQSHSFPQVQGSDFTTREYIPYSAIPGPTTGTLCVLTLQTDPYQPYGNSTCAAA